MPNQHVWSYGYSGWANAGESELSPDNRDVGTVDYPAWHKRLAGGGVGLPMLKMYAELFGGEAGELPSLPGTFRRLVSDDVSQQNARHGGVYVVIPASDDAQENEQAFAAVR